jgi:hypothetical protein
MLASQPFEHRQPVAIAGDSLAIDDAGARAQAGEIKKSTRNELVKDGAETTAANDGRCGLARRHLGSNC